MRPSFLPRLVNDPFGDPGLFIPFLFDNDALLMDLGDLHTLSSKDILKISHVFISHTHMDHFVGFDQMLRILLGRDKHLFLYGPEGFLKNIEGKLAAYSWNLVQNYQNQFAIHAFEITSRSILSRVYTCQEKFLPHQAPENLPFNRTIVKKPAYSVEFSILDHGIPSLAYGLQEAFHINIKKEAVLQMGLSIGPWLNAFKQAIYEQPDQKSLISVPVSGTSDACLEFGLKALAEKIAIITPGQKIVYVADAGYTEENIQRILALANGADQLFIEACFLEAQKDIAGAKYHLTARQAGEIAALANVKQFTIFHFSPRYQDMAQALYDEADEAFRKTVNGY